ncbi:hypothetical protein APR41_05480 [Salegentibacter salinarum]|uniref:Restriction endonuclease type IV Mrr domain-containing protein n=1 Tax=Salegentibacter salinarum TaxID=447422 RepID=A0A2N0TSF4_9FLAO|nr:hypothetical protein [Salegentibacter salinarum]PKD17660.1 hypothetical protein APR41_05480 [Salegentibacter salinarum]SKB50586.1 hypothetical protein SAMN05660903_01122 [Salegentibacter salinarum]
MKVINFEKIHDQFTSEKEIVGFLKKNSNGFVFQIIIERARHYSDLAQYYLEAAYIGQNLSQHSEKISYNLNRSLEYHPIAQLGLRPIATEIEKLGNLIHFYGKVYSGKHEEESETFMEGYYEYRETLEQQLHTFPELVDDYYANYINGEYYEYSPVENANFFESEFKSFPERRFGFWKCAFSDMIGEDFFVSLDSWIIPNTSDLPKILKEYSGIDKINFIKADFFALGNISYLMSDGLITHFPFASLLQAKHCYSNIFDNWHIENDIFNRDEIWMHRFITFDRSFAKLSPQENYKGYPDDRSEELINLVTRNEGFFRPPSVVCFYLSEYGDHILVKDEKCSYLFFGTDKLTHSELFSLSNRLSILFRTTANLAGIHIEIKCPWEKLDDEKFEELCYDIIYHNPKFDNNTIRKMGKSKSRDGGRDIVVHTHSRPGYLPEKYIFQCKYLKPGSSLTATRVIDISDTIDQYGAQGYGIMTSVVIDATLFDKLDAISSRKRIETQEFSVYEMERILARYDNIKHRHFNKTK